MRASVLPEQGTHDRGLADIDRAIELAHCDGLSNKAIILELARRLDEATACWEQVLKAKPKDATALCRRALLLERSGKARGSSDGGVDGLPISVIRRIGPRRKRTSVMKRG